MINSIEIGSITIHFYSLCILLGILCAYIVIKKEAKKNNISDDEILNIIFYGLIVGIIGARLYYVLFNLNYYINNITEIIKVWHGGLAIHGGIISGAIFIIIYSKKHNIKLLTLTDILFPGVLIAQAIGRWGNFFNQEAYGIEVSRTFLKSIFIPNFVIDGMNVDGSYYLPTFYIESIFCIIGFILIIILRKKINKVGFSTAFYLIWYGILRSIIEIFRTDSLKIFNIKVAILVSILEVIIGIIIIVKGDVINDFFRKNKRRNIKN